MKKQEVLKLQEFLEANEFNVYLMKENNIQCAEIEKWTNGGVDMIIYLNPFTEQEFKNRVNDFDIDEEIELHRQNKDYRDAFSIRESLNDFTDFHNNLKEVALKLSIF